MTTLADVPQVRLCLTDLLLVVVLTACHAVRASPLDGVVATGVVVALAGPVLGLGHLLVTAGVGWAWLTGFLVHDGGRLTFAPDDLVRLLVLVVIGAGVGALTRSGISTRVSDKRCQFR